MVTDRFISSRVQPLLARVLPSRRMRRIDDAEVQEISRGIQPGARYARYRRLPSLSGNGTGRRPRCRQSFRPCTRSLHPQAPAKDRLSMPCVCPHGHGTTLLSSTYLSQGAVRSLTGRLGPHGATSGFILFAPHRGNPGVGAPSRFFSRWGTRAGGARFGIADFPLKQKHFPGFLLNAKPLDCPFQNLRERARITRPLHPSSMITG
jgi:hypothetical protein